jgi:hypothetical protein
MFGALRRAILLPAPLLVSVLVCLLVCALPGAGIGQATPAQPPTVDVQTETAPNEAGDPVAFASPQVARTKADQILAQKEFRSVEEPSALQQKIAKLLFLVSQLLNHATDLLPKSSLYGVVLEWGILVTAAGALMFWLWRTNQQQRLDLSVGRSNANELWQKESDNWADRAREEAAKGDWREAVHCLYWSAIVLLEGQKAWRQNRARTPREYVVLLEAGSARRTALQGLTGVFERIWYGLRPAAESDYRQATAMLDQLRAR